MNNNKEKDLSIKTYKVFSFSGKMKVIAIGFLIFIFSTWMHMPQKKYIDDFIKSQISSIPNCPIQYEDITFSWLLPGLDINNILVAGQCLRRPNQNIKINSINLYFSGLSLSPLGLKFSIQAKDGSSTINAYVRVSFSRNRIEIIRTNINSSLINQFMGFGPILSGTISIEGSLDIRGQKLDQGWINLVSTDISTLQANIQGISLPALKIDSLDLKALMDQRSLITIEKADLGTENADIIGRFKGSMNLNQNSLRNSSINVEGSFSLGEKIMVALPIVKLFLANKKAQDGFYGLKLSGRLPRIKPEIL